MKILALDDEENALKLLSNAIRKCLPSSEIYCFQEASEALEFAKNNHIDVAYLDIEMRTINGISFAKKLEVLNNNVNIIFVTGYSQYTLDAFELYASDYILKPVTSKKIQKSLDNLRKPVIEKSHIRVQTFGNFDVFVNNVSVSFKRKKAKECLAYLVDKHGSGATKKEIAAVVLDMDLYDERGQDLTSKILLELERALKAANAKQMLVKKHNYYAVDVSTFDCDLYDYEKGDVKAINSFHGEYMSQYSWAEYSLIFLNK